MGENFSVSADKNLLSCLFLPVTLEYYQYTETKALHGKCIKA